MNFKNSKKNVSAKFDEVKQQKISTKYVIKDINIKTSTLTFN